MLHFFPLFASWGGKPVSKKSACRREGRKEAFFLVRTPCCQIRGLPSFPLASWGGKPVPKKSAGGKEGSVFSTLLQACWCQIRALPCTGLSARPNGAAAALKNVVSHSQWTGVRATHFVVHCREMLQKAQQRILRM